MYLELAPGCKIERMPGQARYVRSRGGKEAREDQGERSAQSIIERRSESFSASKVIEHSASNMIEQLQGTRRAQAAPPCAGPCAGSAKWSAWPSPATPESSKRPAPAAKLRSRVGRRQPEKAECCRHRRDMARALRESLGNARACPQAPRPRSGRFCRGSP